MNISLTPELEQFVDEQVSSGQYQSPSEVVINALSALKEAEAARIRDLEELQTQLRVGITQLDRGEGKPWDAEQMKQHLRERLTNQ
jgi:antitoxin ParD1/3/4